MTEALVPLLLTLKIAVTATVIVLFVGVACAYILGRYSFWGSQIVDAICTLPMVMPPTVLGYYLLVVFGRRGWIGAWLDDHLGIQLIFTWQGAVIASASVAFPLVYRAARAALGGVDHHLENAARVLGGGEAKVFFQVSLPLAWRGVFAGTMLAFARAMGEFGATLMIAGSIPGKTQTISIAIYEAVQAGQDGMANFLVLLTSLVCVCILAASGKLLQRPF
ncbi:MAG: molybdate ABC transporter permease subunit [Candidatus Binatia bacterium]